jgi:hypothetical protein
MFSPIASGSSGVVVETVADDGNNMDKEGPLKEIWGHGTVKIAAALKKAIEEGDRSSLERAATFKDGLVVQQFLDACRESSDKRQWVNL